MKKRVLIAPLSWGLGHATRCIPIIKTLLQHNFEPIIASDGDALQLLQKEFPALETCQLPSYNIRYSNNLKTGLLLQAPKALKTIKKEHLAVEKLVEKLNIQAIISDNRYGVYSNKVPSAIITHQLRVFSGLFTPISTYFQQKLLKNFNECWVPDVVTTPNLSGELSHNIKTTIPTKYIGALSRFELNKTSKNHDVLVLISGPEPLRTKFEQKMRLLFQNDERKVVFVFGKLAKHQTVEQKGNHTYYNFALSNELENLIQQSEVIICRSGYSTVMDLAKLQCKKVLFIPTKGQSEQEYLAKHLMEQGVALGVSEEKIKRSDIEKTANFSGFKNNFSQDLTTLIRFLECE